MERKPDRCGIRPWLLTAVLAVLAAGRTVSPDNRPPRPAAPEIRAGDYRLVLEKLSQSENVVLEFDEQGRATTSGRLNLNLQVAIHSLPLHRLNLDSLDSRVIAFSQAGRPVTFQLYRLEDAEAARTGIWRTLLMAQDADLDLIKLERLQGHLVVYPRATLTTLDFPLTARPPVKLQQGDLSATLREFKREKDRVTVGLEVEWPAGSRISRPNPELPYGISLHSPIGTAHAPSGGSSSMLPGKEGMGMRYTATFSEVRTPATTARLELIVRSGTPEKVPFLFPALPLPDALDLAEDPQVDVFKNLAPGHPLYAEAGGVLTVILPRKAGTPAPVLIGLASAQAGGASSWRWIEADPGPDGRVPLMNLRPGTYRVRWSRPRSAGAGGEAPIPSATIETRILPGQPSTVTLPDVSSTGPAG